MNESSENGRHHYEESINRLCDLDRLNVDQSVAVAQVHAILALYERIDGYLTGQEVIAEAKRRRNADAIQRAIYGDHVGGEGDPQSFLIRGKDDKYHPLEEDGSARS